MEWDKLPGDWPNRAYSSQIASRPHRWHVQQAGSGPVVLMLHGAGASSHSFRALFVDLMQDFHVIALDLPGQGFTKAGNRQRLGLDPMATDIVALMDQMRLSPDAIIGHSAGAAIALRLATILPRKPSAIVSINGALGNFEGLAGIVYPVMAKLMALNPLSATLFSRFSSSDAKVRNLLTATGSAPSEDNVALYRTLVADRSHVDGTLSMMAQWDLGPLLRDLHLIETPTLFLTGAQDKAVPPDISTAAAARMPHATVLQLPGLGHMMHEEDPDAVAALIIDYLGRNGLVSAKAAE